MHNNGSDPTNLSICRKNFWHSACWSIWNFFLLENVRREKCVVKTEVYLFTQWLSSSIKLTTLTFDPANRCMSHIDTVLSSELVQLAIAHSTDCKKLYRLSISTKKLCMQPLPCPRHHSFFFQELFLGRYIYQVVGRRWKNPQHNVSNKLIFFTGEVSKNHFLQKSSFELPPLLQFRKRNFQQ